MLPRNDRFRQPTGAYGIDPRTMSANDIAIAMEETQRGLHGSEFLRSYGQPGPGAPASPFPHIPTQHNARGNYGLASNSNLPHYDLSVPERVRATNLAVSLANHNINPRSLHAQVHPMMCSHGEPPEDFNCPKTVESVKLLGDSQLDRILQQYKLPYDSRSVLESTSSSGLFREGRESITPSRIRQAKIQILFEHLGVTRIVEHERKNRR
ncbi:hypothetical protein FQN57_002433 [Myotisia sp. PD_48]|nr:hypothetical protein FQN57_002433 [Myotisia sp. PD_48]